MEKYYLCLDIGCMEPKYIETSGGDLLEEYDEIDGFNFPGVPTKDEEALAGFCSQHLEIIFDGDLDNAENFNRISAIELIGPRFAKQECGIIILDTSIYLEVEGESGLEEEDFEDIFHLIEPTLTAPEFTIAYGDFSDFSVTLEEAPGSGNRLSTSWKRE